MSFYKPIKGVIWKLKLSKKMNWQTTAEEMKLANKHEKLYSTSLTIEEKN